MKQNIFKKMAAFLSAGLLLTACSQDTLMPEPETPLEKDTDFYINVAIATPGEQITRAGNDSAESYEYGEDDENEIHNILFVFYNSSNKYVGSTTVKLDKDGNYVANGETVGTKKDDFTKDKDKNQVMLNLLVPVNVAAGSTLPSFVMAYVNPTYEGIGNGTGQDGISDSDLRRSLEESLGVTRTFEQVIPCTDTDHPHSGYTLSNSVYYASGQSGQSERERPVIAVRISDNLLDQATVDQANGNDQDAQTAQETVDSKKIMIYVERAVAKVRLNIAENLEDKQTGNTLSPVDDDDVTYTLTFDVKGWGLSNVEKGTFLVKNFRRGGNNVNNSYESYFDMLNLNRSEVNGALTALKNPDWNYPLVENSADWATAGGRSYWAYSPTYFSDEDSKFPSYSDEIEYDAKGNTEFALHYHSFNKMVEVTDNDGTQTFAPVSKYGARAGEYLYTFEHTTVPGIVTDYGKRGVTCAYILGQYTLSCDDEDYDDTGDDGVVRTFYVRNGIKADGTTGNWIYKDDDALRTRILSTAVNGKIYKKLGDTDYRPLKWEGTTDADGYALTETEKGYFEIKHPSKEITGGKYTPNRFVSLQLKSTYPHKTATADVFYLKRSDGSYLPILDAKSSTTVASIDDANIALYNLLNGVEKYDNGLAFFAVPIEHLWRQDNKIGDNGFTAKLGQYGIVRNHVYTIKITGIEGIGTGIGDPDAPIVPNVDQDKYYVKTELRVLPWRGVPAQDVTLKP